jgi:hypothetical protein
MSSYLERLKKIILPPLTDKADKTAKSPINLPFGSFDSSLQGDVEFFSPAAPACCSDCRHAQPATPGDPYCWHTCAAGADRATGWGMAGRRCDRWETSP